MTPTDAALIVGATARLTRLVVADDLGKFWVQEPVSDIAATYADHHDGQAPAWWRYADGLSCPNCVGFWIGAGVLTVTTATKGTRLAKPWRFVMAALTLNVVTVVAGSRVEYWG